MVEVRDIRFAYARNAPRVLDGVGFTAEPGTCTAILGNNGAGKSTLLKCIDRICPVESGAVIVSDKNVFHLSGRELAREIAYVPQSSSGQRITVFDAVLLGRKPYIRWDALEDDRAIVLRVLTRMGLRDLAMKRMTELSGGELQKVVIARALAQEPQFLLLDEPTSSLDMHNQHEVLRTVRAIARERQISVAIIIHDLNLALRYCDRFLLLKDAGVFAAGGAEIVTPEAIEAVYGIRVHIIDHMGVPVIIPFPDAGAADAAAESKECFR